MPSDVSLETYLDLFLLIVLEKIFSENYSRGGAFSCVLFVRHSEYSEHDEVRGFDRAHGIGTFSCVKKTYRFLIPQHSP